MVPEDSTPGFHASSQRPPLSACRIAVFRGARILGSGDGTEALFSSNKRGLPPSNPEKQEEIHMKPDFHTRADLDDSVDEGVEIAEMATAPKLDACPVAPSSNAVAVDLYRLVEPAEANLAHLQGLGRLDQSIWEIFCELVLNVGLLESTATWIDDDARAGLSAVADRALLGLAAIPAASMEDLQMKIVAYGEGGAHNSARALLPIMLRAAIEADINRLAPAKRPHWLQCWLKRTKAGCDTA
jgi:hypothetical protein